MNWNSWCKSQKNIYPRKKFDSFTYSAHICFVTVSDVGGIYPIYPAILS
jgi:hypothetical protein